jgi:hypothetical protein
MYSSRDNVWESARFTETSTIYAVFSSDIFPSLNLSCLASYQHRPLNTCICIYEYMCIYTGLEYSQKGVGGLEGCRIQIVSDAGLTTPFDIRYQYLPIMALSRYIS